MSEVSIMDEGKRIVGSLIREKAKELGTSLLPRFCPLLSIVEDSLIRCVEDECAWWVPYMDGKGGECALALIGQLADLKISEMV